MYGKTMSIPDDLMMQYYELLTDVSLDEWSSCKRAWPTDRFIHATRSGDWPGKSSRDSTRRRRRGPAEEHFDKVHRQREIPEDIPEVTLNAAQLENGRIWIVRLLVEAKLGSAATSEARRLIRQGGVRLDGEVVDDPSTWTGRLYPGTVVKSVGGGSPASS